jgi:hypothetical protein
MAKIPVIREDDGELLGVVDRDKTSWMAQTIFGYTFARAESQAAAEDVVRSEGLQVLQGVWHYYDREDRAWHPCVLKEAYEARVIVIRTNELGYQDLDHYKHVVITNPSDTNLVKT